MSSMIMKGKNLKGKWLKEGCLHLQEKPGVLMCHQDHMADLDHPRWISVIGSIECHLITEVPLVLSHSSAWDHLTLDRDLHLLHPKLYLHNSLLLHLSQQWQNPQRMMKMICGDKDVANKMKKCLPQWNGQGKGEKRRNAKWKQSGRLLLLKSLKSWRKN